MVNDFCYFPQYPPPSPMENRDDEGGDNIGTEKERQQQADENSRCPAPTKRSLSPKEDHQPCGKRQRLDKISNESECFKQPTQSFAATVQYPT